MGSWGLSLFVLFELVVFMFLSAFSSWGLSLFVLFELNSFRSNDFVRSWGLSLFVLFEHKNESKTKSSVLED